MTTAPRRARGTGCIRRRRDGAWVGLISLGMSEDGRRLRATVTGATRDEVEQRLGRLRAAPRIPQRREPRPQVARCERCRFRFPERDIFRGYCGICYPWNAMTPFGVRHPRRPKNWKRFICPVCGIERTTRSGLTSCLDCAPKPDTAQRRRLERVLAARSLGTHTDDEWLSLVEAWTCACAYCGAAGSLTKDHVVPVSRGGSDLIENIAPACKSCNASKSDLTGREFVAVRRATH